MLLSGREDIEFMKRGVEYYVAARYSAWSGLQVCGSLYHHALEMFLKAGLSRKLSLADLKNRFQHRLVDIWDEFKNDFPSSTLTEFDSTIADLAKFEDIRYPDKVLQLGMLLAIDFHAQVQRETSSGPEPEYTLDFYEVDCLIDAIFDVADVNPAFYLSGLNPDVKEMLFRHNPVVAQLWPPSS